MLKHVAGRGPFEWVIAQARAKQVKGIGGRGGEEQREVLLGKRLELGRVRERCRMLGESQQRTGHSALVGVPSARKMVVSCVASESPGKYGVRSISSAKMHPIAQMSTPNE